MAKLACPIYHGQETYVTQGQNSVKLQHCFAFGNVIAYTTRALNTEMYHLMLYWLDAYTSGTGTTKNGHTLGLVTLLFPMAVK